MTWTQVGSIGDLFAFGAGRPIVREEQIEGGWYAKDWPEDFPVEKREVESLDIAYFADGEAIAVCGRSEGPPWSEVTPDPQWSADVTFYTFGVYRATA